MVNSGLKGLIIREIYIWICMYQFEMLAVDMVDKELSIKVQRQK